MRKGLIIYGEPGTGKSTLELNLRQYYLGSALSQNDFETDGRVCFLGRTANRERRVMSTGGAEAMLKLPALPSVEWYVASLPTRGRPGVQVTWEFLRMLDELYAVLLYTDNTQEYVNRRTRFFSKRDSKRRVRPARVRYPPVVRTDSCHAFQTENLESAFCFVQELIGLSSRGTQPSSMKFLEDFTS